MNKLRVLFIGGSGVISSACARVAVESGIELTVLNRGQTATRPLPDGVRQVRGDVRDAGDVRETIKGLDFDCVVDFVAFTTEHVRCGTNFLLTVMVLTIVCYSVFGRPGLALLLLSRAVLIPVIAGLAYELIRLAARNMHRHWVRVAMRPGLLLQRLTTREPTDDQVEVAIAALRAALTAEQLAEVEARAA